MTHLEQAIKDAVEKGGYKSSFEVRTFEPAARMFGLATAKKMHDSHILSDPAFWQALGKARGWDNGNIFAYKSPNASPINNWHRFIDHLAAGKDIESFFASL